jgi:hypothetical protein
MVALGAVFMTAPAQASFTLEAGSPYAAGDSPFGLVTADFDGSGLPDVAAINGNGSTVNVYLRQGAGGFAQDTGSPFGGVSGPNYGAAADFNGDSRPDLALANFVSTTPTIFLRQAAGGFAAEANPPNTGGREGALAAADFNGDTRPDLAIANWDSASVSVFLRQPAGGFAAEGAAVQVGTNPRYITVADFNGDGRPDLAVSNFGSSTVNVLLRNAANTGFDVETAVPVGAGPAGLAAGDFNGDGRPDLAVANSGAASVSVLLRQPAGGFEAEGSVLAVGAGPIGLSAADFNGDGRPDLAVASNSASQVAVLLRQAAGGFAVDAGSPIAVSNAYFPAAADFNGDGRPDLAVSQAAPAGAVAILINAAPAATPPTQGPPAPPAPPVPGKSAVVRVVSGKVLIRYPAGKAPPGGSTTKFGPLTGAANIPIGSTIDTTKGRVALTTAADTAGKKTQTAEFYQGIFQVKQAVPKRKPKKPAALTTDLVMKGQISRSQCAPLKGARGATVDAKKKKKGPNAVLGKLWGSGKGKFRTTGKYSSATVRGTIWLTQDQCNGTLTKVRRGVVAVRDFKRKKTVNVKAGHSYLARALRAAAKSKR